MRRAIVLAAAIAATVFAGDALAQQRGQGRGGPGGSPARGSEDGGPAPMQREATESDAGALLDQELVTDPARLEAARTKAAQQPPTTEDVNVLTRFYAERGEAARMAGNQQQALQDFRKAVDYMRRGVESIDKSQLLLWLANAEAAVNRRTVAAKLIEEAIKYAAPLPQRGRVVALYTALASYDIQSGNIDGADAALTQARAIIREFENNPRRAGNPVIRRTVGMTLAATAGVQEFRGQYAEAEANRRKAITELEANNLPLDQPRILLQRVAIANNLRFQGRLNEAENDARLALAAAQRETGVNSLPTARALFALALVLSDQGRAPEAEGLARRSMELLQATGMQTRGGAQQALANILAAQGKWPEAMAAFDTMRQAFQSAPDEFESLMSRNLMLPLALLKTGKTAEAEQRLARMYEGSKAGLGDKHATTAEILGFLAMAHAAGAQQDRALGEFAEATQVLLSRSRDSSDTDDSGSASAQDQRTRMVLEAYIDVLASVRGTDLPAKHKVDPVAESFRLADAAHSRGVLRALAASAARAAASNPQLADTARRVQDAEKQISALNGLLANAISARAADRDEGAIKDLRRRIDRLRDERADLMRDIERKFPDYARLINPQPATVADVAKTLRPGEAMVAFFSGEKHIYAWVVPQSGAAAMVAAALDHQGLAAAVSRLRKALDPNAATLDDIPAFDVAEANKLYSALLQPMEAAWSNVTSLFVVPDGALGQLPLALLVTAPVSLPRADADGVPFSRYRAVPWLARKAGITQLPSVASLGALRALPPAGGTRRPFVGFGDPWFSKQQAAEAAQEAAATQVASLVTRGIRLRSAPKGDGNFTAEISQLPRLADTADEVRAVAAALHADAARDVFIGVKASKTTVKSLDLSNARIVMFATHGLVPGDLSGLNQPALALTAPDVSGNPADGLLTVEDILALKLNADWVVLSACNTAAGQGAGAEAVSGLGRAFFYAGTRALLVSNWPVETSSARTLTTDLFRRQVDTPGLSRAEALRQAELALIDSPGAVGPDGKPLFAYAHPIFWAPFSLVGDGGGAPGPR
ncbi:MAG TPA: CHAT domain-containing tetratricopeptide repeat protein [Alphaproteobacteria bacterium]